MTTVIASHASEAMSQYAALKKAPEFKLHKRREPTGLVGAIEKRGQMVLEAQKQCRVFRRSWAVSKHIKKSSKLNGCCAKSR